MDELHFPWMELSILLPLPGAILVAATRDAARARSGCLMICVVTLLCAVAEWADFTSLQTFAARDRWDLVAAVFGREVFVIDELSAPLLPLAALLCFLTVLSTHRTKAGRFSFSRLLVSESILLATLSCRTAWIVIALLAAATIPVQAELRERKQNSRVFRVHMTGFVLLLVAGQAIVESGWFLTGGALLTLAALLRTGVAPLHCWITDLFERASFGTALLFVAPLTGAYAVMRLVLPIAPGWALQIIAISSLVTAVYAAGMALVQHEARRFFCYLFLSHSSLVLAGLELATPVGLTGGLCVWLSVELALSGFGLTLRCIEARVGRLSLDRYHGLYDHMPALAAVFLLTGLASIGFPGTVGFVGTELLIEGAVGVFPLLGTAVVLATTLNGIAVLQAGFRLFAGRQRHATFSMQAGRAEKSAVLILTLLILGGGVAPQWGVASRYHAARMLIAQPVPPQPQARVFPETSQPPAAAAAARRSQPMEISDGRR